MVSINALNILLSVIRTCVKTETALNQLIFFKGVLCCCENAAKHASTSG